MYIVWQTILYLHSHPENQRGKWKLNKTTKWTFQKKPKPATHVTGSSQKDSEWGLEVGGHVYHPGVPLQPQVGICQ